ncbi:hypothetical protein ACFX15_046164 [Malus domestica]
MMKPSHSCRPLPPPPKFPSSPRTPQFPITLHLPQSTRSHQNSIGLPGPPHPHPLQTIAAVHSEADEFQRLIQWQETVDSVRTSEREKLRINESLMRLLLKLDSDPR